MSRAKAKTILYAHAQRNDGFFVPGQVKWIVDAMEEYSAEIEAERIEYKKYVEAKAFLVDHPNEDDFVNDNVQHVMTMDGPSDNSISLSDFWRNKKRLVGQYENKQNSKIPADEK